LSIYPFVYEDGAHQVAALTHENEQLKAKIDELNNEIKDLKAKKKK